MCNVRAKSRRDLEVYLGANGQVCKDRARQYGHVRTVRIRTDQGDPDLHNSAICEVLELVQK
ncbi:hypothetical protein Bca4012_102541 [Brassica carinata]